ncbi:MAG: hypothetical protein Q9195_009281 [Heterodermia aff. obscurata]
MDPTHSWVCEPKPGKRTDGHVVSSAQYLKFCGETGVAPRTSYSHFGHNVMMFTSLVTLATTFAMVRREVKPIGVSTMVPCSPMAPQLPRQIMKINFPRHSSLSALPTSPVPGSLSWFRLALLILLPRPFPRPSPPRPKTSLLLGLFLSSDQAVLNNELAALRSPFATYGQDFIDLIAGVSVGSEDFYRISPTGIENDSGTGVEPAKVTDCIGQVRSLMASTAANGKAIGHVDTWTAWVNSSNDAVINACDFIGMDACPSFQNTMSNSIDSGEDLFFDAYYDTVALSDGKPVSITETGWPRIRHIRWRNTSFFAIPGDSRSFYPNFPFKTGARVTSVKTLSTVTTNPVSSNVAVSPAEQPNGHCPSSLSGEFQYPHLIISVEKSAPDTAQGNSYNAHFAPKISSIFNFDIIPSYNGLTCSLIFLFPTRESLRTSNCTLSGSGCLNVAQLQNPATAETAYNTISAVTADIGAVPEIQPGGSYQIALDECAAGTRIGYKVDATGDLDPEYFQDYSPAPIGLYLIAC